MLFKKEKPERIQKIADTLVEPEHVFKAKLNPFKNHDTAESLKKVLNLDAIDPKRPYLTRFIAEMQYKGIFIPENPFNIEAKMKERIKSIIDEENRKMRANDSWEQKFDRMKREVEELIEAGYTFKKGDPNEDFSITLQKTLQTVKKVIKQDQENEEEQKTMD